MVSVQPLSGSDQSLLYRVIYLISCPYGGSSGKSENCHHEKYCAKGGYFLKNLFHYAPPRLDRAVFLGRTFFPFCEQHFKCTDHIFSCISRASIMVSTYPLAAAEETEFCKFSVLSCFLSKSCCVITCIHDLGCKVSIHHTDLCVLPMRIPCLHRLLCCS